jgi:hypothetical protein
MFVVAFNQADVGPLLCLTVNFLRGNCWRNWEAEICVKMPQSAKSGNMKGYCMMSSFLSNSDHVAAALKNKKFRTTGAFVSLSAVED